MAFRRFELVKHQKGSTFGTIDKYGRLLLPQSIVEDAELAGGQHVELYYDPEERQIGLMKVPAETMYSVRVKVNAKKSERQKSESLAVSVQTLLTSYGIFVPKRIRGRMGVAPDGMIVFKFEDLQEDPTRANGALAAAPLAAFAAGEGS